MKVYKDMAKKFFADYVKAARKNKERTQEQMAEEMRISSRAYGDLERGKFCFSALSLLFFLFTLKDEEILQFIQDFRTALFQVEEQEVA